METGGEVKGVQENTSPGSAGAPVRRPSAASVAANQANARRSTGPTTAEGKAGSAQNAVRTGVWAMGPCAVTRGEFAEDPAEVGAFLDGIVESLAPRDDVEGAQAQIVAIRYLQVCRVGRLEPLMLGAAGTVSAYSRRSNNQSIATAEAHAELVEQLLAWIGGDIDAAEVDFEAATRFLLREHPSYSGWKPWEEDEPTTRSDWEQAFQRTRARVWPDDTTALTWLREQRLFLAQQLPDLKEAAVDQAAQQVLERFGELTETQRRISRGLERALADYERLQARPRTAEAPSPTTVAWEE